MYGLRTSLPVELEWSTRLPKGFTYKSWKEENGPWMSLGSHTRDNGPITIKLQPLLLHFTATVVHCYHHICHCCHCFPLLPTTIQTPLALPLLPLTLSTLAETAATTTPTATTAPLLITVVHVVHCYHDCCLSALNTLTIQTSLSKRHCHKHMSSHHNHHCHHISICHHITTSSPSQLSLSSLLSSHNNHRCHESLSQQSKP